MTHRIVPAGPLTFFVLAVGAGLLAAEEPQPNPSELYETATVRARAIDRSTGAVSVIDREAIEALDVSSVADLIRLVPGLDLTSAGGRGGIATAQIRGGDPNFTAVLVDGVPLNDVTDTFGGTVDLASLPTAHVERVEVIRGPTSSYFGSTGLAGAINIITRRGPAGGGGWEVETSAGGDSTTAAALSLYRASERTSYFVGTTWDREDGRMADDEFAQAAVQGRADITLGETDLRISGRVSSWETDDYPEASGGPGFGDGRTRNSVHDEAGVGVRWSWGESTRRQVLYANLYRHELERESPGVFGVSDFVPPSSERTRYTHSTIGLSPPVLRRGRSSWSFGVEIDHQVGDSDSTLLLPALFGGPTDASYRETRTTGGARAEATYDWDRWILEIGARIDLPSRFDAELSPRVGVLFEAAESTIVRASVGRAFKLPSFFALFAPAALGGNPELDPETSVGIDLGVEQRFETGRVALTLFHNRFEDLIDFDFDTFMNVNRSGVSVSGGELAASWNPVDSLALRVNATRQNFDTDLRQRPDWIGGAAAIWSVREDLRWTVQGEWVSERFDEQIPVGPGEVPSFPLFGTSLSYRATDRWELGLRVDNLLDEEYETGLGFPGPDRLVRVTARRRSGPRG